ncbi:amidohydrolase [Amycolatopsis acidiphila]|uniref:Amidohydrolase n=1 Tax=Amycolatopsis acidiphila TaxID=715473 RepID=A0A558AJU7_9PSEU|nr:amidohydrolase [Amycolatopsis acidiphila]TVT24547.1 amidohydrolase [Amycolatopsis acidiphila]UIJ59240.1 amidohydrolase [Amycolatopsis acidiphila]GHG79299.1 amidohydrolase [Amycolatopsis acidiphila]
MRVDAVYENARVFTGESWTSAVAVLHGRIVALGEDAESLSTATRVDLGGAVVVPGFHDAHNHMAWFGMSLDEVALGECKHVDEVYAAVAERAAQVRPGGWIVGSGYDQNRLIGGHPTRHGLDRAAPGHLVRLKHTSGHMVVVSSNVLDRLDVANVPAGGDVVLDPEGSPTGLLREQAQLLLRPLIYPTPLETVVRAIDRAGERYLSEGITSAQEAGVGGGLVGETPAEVLAYQLARDRGVLRVRSTVMVSSAVLHELPDGAGFGLDLGMRTGMGDEWLRIGPMKLFADGSLIGRTAAMHEDFSNEPGNRGYFQQPEDELAETVFKAHAAGWQVATHAIGDRAISTILDAYEAALRANPRADHRHRIEHCAVVSPADLARIVALELVPVPQGRFVNEIGDGMAAALGPAREDWCYRLRTFLDAGCVLPGSSDRPVVRGAPLLGLADMVHRRTSSGRLLGAGERITPVEALRAYTYGSAYAAFRERELGTLETGKLADFVVLSADPTESPEDASVLATAVGGTLAYERGMTDARP